MVLRAVLVQENQRQHYFSKITHTRKDQVYGVIGKITGVIFEEIFEIFEIFRPTQ